MTGWTQRLRPSGVNCLTQANKSPELRNLGFFSFGPLGMLSGLFLPVFPRWKGRKVSGLPTKRAGNSTFGVEGRERKEEPDQIIILFCLGGEIEENKIERANVR